MADHNDDAETDTEQPDSALVASLRQIVRTQKDTIRCLTEALYIERALTQKIKRILLPLDEVEERNRRGRLLSQIEAELDESMINQDAE
jgi:hypothetical protein